MGPNPNGVLIRREICHVSAEKPREDGHVKMGTETGTALPPQGMPRAASGCDRRGGFSEA